MVSSHEPLNEGDRERLKIHVSILTSERPHEALANLRAGDKSALFDFRRRWGRMLSREKAGELKLLPEGPVIFDENFYRSYEEQLQSILKLAWRGEESALQQIHDWITSLTTMSWEFDAKGNIQLVLGDLWTMICFLFLRDLKSGKTGLCPNPGCSAPFFIRNRRTQEFCATGSCVIYAQRQHGKDYWKTMGKKRRDARRRALKHVKKIKKAQ